MHLIKLLKFRVGCQNFVAAAHVTTIWYDPATKRWFFRTTDDVEGEQTSIDPEFWQDWVGTFQHLVHPYEPLK